MRYLQPSTLGIGIAHAECILVCIGVPMGILIAMFLAASIATAQHPPGQVNGNATPVPKEWAIVYMWGTKDIEQSWKLKMAVGKDAIVCRNPAGKAFTIPVADVFEISYDTYAHSHEEGIARAGLGVVANSGGGVILTFPAVLVVTGLATQVKTNRHFVEILWQENGTTNEAFFELGRSDYLGVLEELTRATGKAWRNLPEERRKIKEELKQAKDSATALVIDRNVFLDSFPLKPGLYQLVLLERNENQGELYLFAGKKINPSKIVAQAHVRIERSPGPTGVLQATYKAVGEPPAITDIQLPHSSLGIIPTWRLKDNQR